MSTQPLPIVSKIEGQTFNTTIHTATKDGYFVPGSPLSLGHEVNNDAGLLIFPDGRLYIVAFTAFDAVDVEGDAIGLVIRALEQPELSAIMGPDALSKG